MRTRTRKILRDLWARKLRTILVAASIFVGVFGVVTLYSTGELLVEQLEKDLQQERLAMLRVNVTTERGAEVDNETYLEALRDEEAVMNALGDNEDLQQQVQENGWANHIEARVVFPLYWRQPGDELFEDGYIITHSEDFTESYLEPPRLHEGHWPGEAPADTCDNMTDESGQPMIQVAVERRLASNFGVSICDTLEVRNLASIRNGESGPSQQRFGATTGDATALTVSGSNPDAAMSAQQGESVETVKVIVVGEIFQAYGYRAGPGTVPADTLVFAQYDDAQTIAGFTGYTSIYARFDEFSVAQEKELLFQRVVSNVADSPYRVTFSLAEDPAENSQIESTRAQNNILVFLAFAALIVSGFLVINVISAIISEQRRQIGSMKAIGATTFDNIYMYTGIATMYGLIGVIPGVLLGIPAGYFAAQGLAAQSETIIEEFGISPTGIILGVVVGLAVPFFSSLIPVLLGTRVSILEAMSNQGIKAEYGRGFWGFLERRIGHLPLPIGVQQAVNNAFQKKGRLLLTGLTLTIANGAFMGIFSVFYGLTNVADETFATFGYQIQVTLTEGQEFDDIQQAINNNVDGLEAVEPGITLAIQIQDYDAPPINAGPPGVFAYGFDPANENVFVLNEDTMVEPDRNPFLTDGTITEDVVISKRIADEGGYEVGDEITLIVGRSQPQSFDIIGIVNYPFDGVWMDWRELARFAGFVTEDGDPYANSLNIIMASDEPTAEEVDERISEIEEVLLNMNITSDSQNQVELQELILTIVIILGVVLSLGAFLIAAVGGIGLLIMLSISVFERQREIGVMRSVGATSWAVANQFLIEGIIVGTAAWLLAIPISLVLRLGLLQFLPFGSEFEIGYPPETLLVGLLGMIFLVTIASVWPSLAASRRTVSDILRYQ